MQPTDPEDDMGKNSSTPKKAAKGAAVYYAGKKLFKGAFLVAAVAAVGKVLRSGRTA